MSVPQKRRGICITTGIVGITNMLLWTVAALARRPELDWQVAQTLLPTLALFVNSLLLFVMLMVRLSSVEAKDAL